MVRLRDWLVAGAVVPAAMVLLPGIVVIFSMGVDDAVSTMGVILLSMVLLVPPGALLGAILGMIVLVLARRLPAPGHPDRRPALVRASVGTALVSVCACVTLLRFTASDGLAWYELLAYGAAFATIPTALAIIAFRRWRPTPARAAGAPNREAPSATSP
ncbi:hypothetical protein HP550_04640 [Cellulomonas humilata]|uniref:Uncharacterized protein n=1 Tax=Cellulomonas humilata TaxID=144055 RepID=A0A7Y6A0R6_9CELL|nr:hypothetical protein [Cellulomonas humilata]NUU16532.1 hypothetical protein [Cellulomonas humilata]